MTSSSSSRISAVRPLWAVEAGRVTIEGSNLPVEPGLPRVMIGGAPARLTAASSSELTAVVPSGLEGGHTPIRIEEVAGETARARLADAMTTHAGWAEFIRRLPASGILPDDADLLDRLFP